MVTTPTYNPSRQASLVTYSRTLDSTAFWNRLIEHIFVLAFFAWLSAGFLARKEFRVDLTEAHLAEVSENLFGFLLLKTCTHSISSEALDARSHLQAPLPRHGIGKQKAIFVIWGEVKSIRLKKNALRTQSKYIKRKNAAIPTHGLDF